MTRTRVPFLLALLLLVLPAALRCMPPEPPGGEPPLGLFVTPEEPVVTVGGTIQLVATAFYDDGETADVTAACEWSVVQGDAIEVSSGLDSEGRVTGLAEGNAAVMAVFEEIESEAVVVRVTEADVVELTITPASLTLEQGASAWLTAMASFSDGTRGDVSGSVRWITGNSDVCTVGQDGKVTGAGVGSTQVRAEYEDIGSDPATVDVTPGGTGDDDDDDTTPGDDDDDDDDTTPGDDDDDTGLPNLVVTFFYASVDADAGETSYLIDVTNDGDAPAEIFFVDLFLDDYQPGIGDDGDEYQLLEDVAAGETVYADFVVQEVPDYYEWWSYVILDTTDDVVESDEGDNISGPLTVYPPE